MYFYIDKAKSKPMSRGVKYWMVSGSQKHCSTIVQSLQNWFRFVSIFTGPLLRTCLGLLTDVLNVTLKQWTFLLILWNFSDACRYFCRVSESWKQFCQMDVLIPPRRLSPQQDCCWRWENIDLRLDLFWHARNKCQYPLYRDTEFVSNIIFAFSYYLCWQVISYIATHLCFQNAPYLFYMRSRSSVFTFYTLWASPMCLFDFVLCKFLFVLSTSFEKKISISYLKSIKN